MVQTEKKANLIGWVLVAILAGTGTWFLLARLSAQYVLNTDDAYITYRYARNIAAGLGFTYNPGERVLGTTTPLYTLILATCARQGWDIPRSSNLINVCAGAATVALLSFWLMCRTLRISIGLIASVLLLASSLFTLFAVSGMETSLYIFLIVLSFMLYDAGWVRSSAFTSALCLLVRMDGAAVGAALLLHHLIARRQRPAMGIVISYLVPLIPWFTFALWYFHGVLPQSMLAKHQHIMEADRWWMLKFCLEYPTLFMFLPAMAGIGFALFRGASIPGLSALVLWAAMYVSAYTIFRIDLYRWYLSPLTPALAGLCAYGLYELFLAPRSADAPARQPRAAVVLLVLAIAPYAGSRALDTYREAKGSIYWAQTTEMSRADAADAILKDGRPEDRICTGAIGIVGWRTNAYLRDVMGLISKDTVGHPVPEILRSSNARWYISEISSKDHDPPEIEGFDLVGTFNRGQAPTFLLYQRIGSEQYAQQLAQQTLVFGNGLTVRAAKLTDRLLRVTLTTVQPLPKYYKFFVHIYRPGQVDGKPYQICDSYPTLATSQMQPNIRYQHVVSFKEALPKDGAVIKLGMFDETDPRFPPLTDEQGRIQLILTYPGQRVATPTTTQSAQSQPKDAAR